MDRIHANIKNQKIDYSASILLEKKIGDKIFWKYLITFQLAKSADWCLGPFVYEFFEKYHHLNTDMIGKLIAISFLAGLFLGPLLVGYLNDKSDRKFP